MAEILIPYGIQPDLIGLSSSSSFSLTSLNSTTTRVAYLFQAHEAATITSLGFRYGSRTGTPPTYRISLQGIDTSGNPDGTIKGGGSPASATFTPPASTAWNSSWQDVALTNSYSCTRGEWLSSVIDYSSGTVNASNFSTFTTGNSGMTTLSRGFPCAATGAVWAKSTLTMPIFRYSSSSRSYGIPLLSQGTTGPSSSGNRAALKFTMPSGSCTSFKCCGFLWQPNANLTAASSFVGGLWSAGATLHSVSVDNDFPATAGARQWIRVMFTDSTLQTLTPGTDYYCGVEHSGSTLFAINLTFPDANGAQAASNYSGACLSTYNGSSWSDTTSNLPMIIPLITDVTSSGGSASTSRVIGA